MKIDLNSVFMCYYTSINKDVFTFKCKPMKPIKFKLISI